MTLPEGGMEWQPIETAPRDKTVDLWCNNRRVANCHWMDEGEADPEAPACWAALDHRYDGFYPVIGATHWMLILPPKALNSESNPTRTGG